MKPNYDSHARRHLQVFVFRNLHQRGVVWSVRNRAGHTILHANNVMLKDAVFVVNRNGRDRVRVTGQKEVHAGVRGELLVDPAVMASVLQGLLDGRDVRYNPYEHDTFVTANGQPLHTADYVLLSSVGNRSRVTYIFDPQKEAYGRQTPAIHDGVASREGRLAAGYRRSVAGAYAT